MKHTTGPWEVFRSANRGKSIQISVPLEASHNAGEYIATTMGACREANARLIAAAPELLEACMALIRAGMIGRDVALAADMARAAIAKATDGAE